MHHPPSPLLDGILAVSFDAGGTLIEPWPTVGHVYAEVAARHGVIASATVLNRQFAAAWKAKRNFSHERSEWAALVDASFAGIANPPPSRTFFPEIYDRFAQPEVWRVYDDVRPCLLALQERGLRLAVISNWDERLRPLLQLLGLAKFFDPIIVSLEVGCPKPGAEIFRRAAELLKYPTNCILHVGDSANEDVAGARAAGFRAVLLDRNKGRRARQLAVLTDLSC